MSKEIDQRVVQMEFDNKQFEANVAATRKSLDGLNKDLRFEGAAKGFDNINAAARNVSFDGMTSGIVSAKMHFSALEVIGITALSNITTSVMRTAQSIINMFAIQPPSTGFNEYELKMGSIQTIMASTGESLDTVNRYLDELNKYSDDTIYSFQDMTTNIGKFTNAGVELKDAVAAIKGVSNEAAVSGANANEASRAMYNFAQALSAGYVKLIDWKSIENANMATVEFKNELIKTAVEVGTLTEAADGMYDVVNIVSKNNASVLNATRNFNDSLGNQWMTTEVLTKTLAKYADQTTDIGKKATEAATRVKTFSMMMDTLREAAQSGWAQTWEIVFGNFDESTELWTNLSKTIGGVIDKIDKYRNSILKLALKNTNFKANIQAFDEFKKIIEDAGITESNFQKELSKTVKANGQDLDALIKQYGSLQAVIASGAVKKNVIITTIKNIAKSITTVKGEITNAADAVKDVTDKVEYFNNVVNSVIRGDFGNGEDRIKALTEAGYEYSKVQNLVNYIWERNGQTWSDCTLSAEELANVIGEMSKEELVNIGYTEEQAESIKKLAEEAKYSGTSLSELIDKMQTKKTGRELIIESLANAFVGLKKVLKSVSDAWNDIFPPKSAEEKAEGIYGIILAINKFSEKLIMSNKTADEVTRTFRGLFAVLDMIRMIAGGALNIAFRILKEVLSAFNLDIWEFTALIGDALVAMRDWVKEHDALGKAIKGVAGIIVIVIKAIQDFLVKTGLLDKAADSFKEFSKIAIKSLTEFYSAAKESGNVPKYILSGFVNGLTKGIPALAKSAFDFAKTILKSVCEVLGIHSPSKEFFAIAGWCIKGFVNGIKEGAIIAISAIKNVFTTILDTAKDFGITFSTVISAIMTLAFLKMAFAFSEFIESIGGIAEGLKKLSKAAAFDLVAHGLLVIAISIGILTIALMQLTKINAVKLWSAIGALSVLFIVLTGFAALLTLINHELSVSVTQGNGLVKMLPSIIAIAIAMYILVKALKTLSNMDSDALTQGLIALGSLVVALGSVMIGLATLGSLGVDASLKTVSKMMIEMAIALGLTMFVMKYINKLKPEEMMPAITWAVLFAAYVKLLCLASAGAGNNLDKVSNMMLKLSESMLIMALVMKILGTMSLDEIGPAIASLTGITTLMIILLAFMKGLAVDNYTGKAAANLIAVTVCIGLLSLLAILLGKVNIFEFAKGLILVALVGKVIQGLIKATKDAGKATGMLLTFSLCILVLTGCVIALSILDPKKLIAPMLVLAGLMAMIGVMMKISKGIEASKITLITLAVMVATLSGVLIALTCLDTKKSLLAAAALTIVMLAIGAMMKIVSSCGKDSIGNIGALAVIGVVIAAIGGILIALAALDVKSSLSAAVAVSLVLLAMSASLLVISNVGNIGKSTIGALAVLTLVLAAVAGIMGLLSYAESKWGFAIATKDAIALGVLLNTMASALLILSKINNVEMPDAGRLLGNMTIMAVVVAELGAVLGILNKLKLKSSLTDAVALSVLVNALATAMVIMSSAIIDSKTVATALLMGAVVAELAVALGLLKNVKSESAIAHAVALGTLLLALSTALIPLTQAGKLSGGNIKIMLTGIEGLCILIGATGLMALVAGIIESIGPLSTAIHKGMPLLEELCGSIGKMIGNFVGGIVAGIIKQGMDLAGDLVDFMKDLEPFWKALDNLDNDSLKKMDLLTKCLTRFASAELKDAISKAINTLSGSDTFSMTLKSFGYAMRTFVGNMQSMGEIDDKKINKGIEIGNMIADVAKAFKGMDIKGELAMLDSMPKIAEQIKNFADKLNDLSLGDNELTIAKTICDGAAEMLESVKNNNTGISTFTEGMQGLAEGILTFSDTINGAELADLELVKHAVEIGKEIASLYECMPGYDGIFQIFAGNKKSLSSFSVDIGMFAAGLVAFSNTISKEGENLASEEAVERAITIGEGLANLYAYMPKVGGIMSWLTGHKKSLASFGTDIGLFADGLITFSNKMLKIISTKNLIDTIEICDALARLNGSLSSDWVGVNNNAVFESFGEGIETLGGSLSKYSDTIKNVDASQMANVTLQLQKLVNWMNSINNASVLSEFTSGMQKMADTGVSKFCETMSGSYDKACKSFNVFIGNYLAAINGEVTNVKTAFASLATSALDGLKEKNEDATTAGRVITELFCKEIKKEAEDDEDGVSATFASVVKIAALSIENLRSRFVDAGKFLVEGFALGITTYGTGANSTVDKAARQMAVTAYNSAMDEMDAHSPSRLFEKVGSYVPAGFAIGIGLLQNEVKTAASNMANTAVEGAEYGLSALSNIVTDDIDANPVITPVLDLSNIEAGSSIISDLMGRSGINGVASLNLAANAGVGVRSSRNDLSALSELASKLGNTSTNNTVTNNFNITGDNPTEIANEVSRILQKQVERRDALWA